MKRFLARSVELTIWLVIILVFITDWLVRVKKVEQHQHQPQKSGSVIRHR